MKWEPSDNTINNIDKFVDGVLWDGDHPWDAFLYALREGRVLFPGHNEATLEEEHQDQWEGESWFVFKMTGGRDVKYYKRSTICDSFGANQHGQTTEVYPVKIERTDWEVA